MIPGPLDRNQFRRAGAQGAQHTPQQLPFSKHNLGLEKFRQLHGDEYGQCARNDRRRNFRTACNLNF